MPGFSISPSTGFPLPTGEPFPPGLQWQFAGEDVGVAGQFDTINVVPGDTLNVTAGTGETANVVTITIPWGSGVAF